MDRCGDEWFEVASIYARGWCHVDVGWRQVVWPMWW